MSDEVSQPSEQLVEIGVPFFEVAEYLGLSIQELKALNPELENVDDEAFLPSGLALKTGGSLRRKARLNDINNGNIDEGAEETEEQKQDVNTKNATGDALIPAISVDTPSAFEDNEHANSKHPHHYTVRDASSTPSRQKQTSSSTSTSSPQPSSSDNNNNIINGTNAKDSNTTEETLASISKKVGVPIEELRKSNPSLQHQSDDAPIPVGTPLRVPKKKHHQQQQEQTSSSFENKMTNNNSSTIDDNKNSNNNKSDRNNGKSLNEISQETGIPVAVLRESNPNLSDKLKNDDEKIPEGTPIRVKKSVAHSATNRMDACVNNSGTSSSTVAASFSPATTNKTARKDGTTTLENISDETGLSVEEIRQQNPWLDEDRIKNDDPLPIGTALKLTTHDKHSSSKISHHVAGIDDYEENSLEDISQQTGVPVHILRASNPQLPAETDSKKTLPKGTKLTLKSDLMPIVRSHGDGVSTGGVSSTKNNNNNSNEENKDQEQDYSQSHSLKNISSHVGLTPEELRKLNPSLANLKNDDRIPFGTQLNTTTIADDSKSSPQNSRVSEDHNKIASTTSPTSSSQQQQQQQQHRSQSRTGSLQHSIASSSKSPAHRRKVHHDDLYDDDTEGNTVAMIIPLASATNNDNKPMAVVATSNMGTQKVDDFLHNKLNESQQREKSSSAQLRQLYVSQTLQTQESDRRRMIIGQESSSFLQELSFNLRTLNAISKNETLRQNESFAASRRRSQQFHREQEQKIQNEQNRKIAELQEDLEEKKEDVAYLSEQFVWTNFFIKELEFRMKVQDAEQHDMVTITSEMTSRISQTANTVSKSRSSSEVVNNNDTKKTSTNNADDDNEKDNNNSSLLTSTTAENNRLLEETKRQQAKLESSKQDKKLMSSLFAQQALSNMEKDRRAKIETEEGRSFVDYTIDETLKRERMIQDAKLKENDRIIEERHSSSQQKESALQQQEAEKKQKQQEIMFSKQITQDQEAKERTEIDNDRLQEFVDFNDKERRERFNKMSKELSEMQQQKQSSNDENLLKKNNNPSLVVLETSSKNNVSSGDDSNNNSEISAMQAELFNQRHKDVQNSFIQLEQLDRGELKESRQDKLLDLKEDFIRQMPKPKSSFHHQAATDENKKADEVVASSKNSSGDKNYDDKESKKNENNLVIIQLQQKLETDEFLNQEKFARQDIKELRSEEVGDMKMEMNMTRPPPTTASYSSNQVNNNQQQQRRSSLSSTMNTNNKNATMNMSFTDSNALDSPTYAENSEYMSERRKEQEMSLETPRNSNNDKMNNDDDQITQPPLGKKKSTTTTTISGHHDDNEHGGDENKNLHPNKPSSAPVKTANPTSTLASQQNASPLRPQTSFRKRYHDDDEDDTYHEKKNETDNTIIKAQQENNTATTNNPSSSTQQQHQHQQNQATSRFNGEPESLDATTVTGATRTGTASPSSPMNHHDTANKSNDATASKPPATILSPSPTEENVPLTKKANNQPATAAWTHPESLDATSKTNYSPLYPGSPTNHNSNNDVAVDPDYNEATAFVGKSRRQQTQEGTFAQPEKDELLAEHSGVKKAPVKLPPKRPASNPKSSQRPPPPAREGENDESDEAKMKDKEEAEKTENNNNKTASSNRPPPPPRDDATSDSDEFKQKQGKKNTKQSASAPSSRDKTPDSLVETLDSLSYKTGISVDKLKEFNPALAHLDPSKDIIPEGSIIRLKPTNNNKSESEKWSEQSNTADTFKPTTLETLAMETGMSVDELREANPQLSFFKRDQQIPEHISLHAPSRKEKGKQFAEDVQSALDEEKKKQNKNSNNNNIKSPMMTNEQLQKDLQEQREESLKPNPNKKSLRNLASKHELTIEEVKEIDPDLYDVLGADEEISPIVSLRLEAAIKEKKRKIEEEERRKIQQAEFKRREKERQEHEREVEKQIQLMKTSNNYNNDSDKDDLNNSNSDNTNNKKQNSQYSDLDRRSNKSMLVYGSLEDDDRQNTQEIEERRMQELRYRQKILENSNKKNNTVDSSASPPVLDHESEMMMRQREKKDRKYFSPFSASAGGNHNNNPVSSNASTISLQEGGDGGSIAATDDLSVYNNSTGGGRVDEHTKAKNNTNTRANNFTSTSASSPIASSEQQQQQQPPRVWEVHHLFKKKVLQESRSTSAATSSTMNNNSSNNLSPRNAEDQDDQEDPTTPLSRLQQMGMKNHASGSPGPHLKNLRSPAQQNNGTDGYFMDRGEKSSPVLRSKKTERSYAGDDEDDDDETNNLKRRIRKPLHAASGNYDGNDYNHNGEDYHEFDGETGRPILRRQQNNNNDTKIEPSAFERRTRKPLRVSADNDDYDPEDVNVSFESGEERYRRKLQQSSSKPQQAAPSSLPIEADHSRISPVEYLKKINSVKNETSQRNYEDHQQQRDDETGDHQHQPQRPKKTSFFSSSTTTPNSGKDNRNHQDPTRPANNNVIISSEVDRQRFQQEQQAQKQEEFMKKMEKKQQNENLDSRILTTPTRDVPAELALSDSNNEDNNDQSILMSGRNSKNGSFFRSALASSNNKNNNSHLQQSSQQSASASSSRPTSPFANVGNNVNNDGSINLSRLSPARRNTNSTTSPVRQNTTTSPLRGNQGEKSPFLFPVSSTVVASKNSKKSKADDESLQQELSEENFNNAEQNALSGPIGKYYDKKSQKDLSRVNQASLPQELPVAIDIPPSKNNNNNSSFEIKKSDYFVAQDHSPTKPLVVNEGSWQTSAVSPKNNSSITTENVVSNGLTPLQQQLADEKARESERQAKKLLSDHLKEKEDAQRKKESQDTSSPTKNQNPVFSSSGRKKNQPHRHHSSSGNNNTVEELIDETDDDNDINPNAPIHFQPTPSSRRNSAMRKRNNNSQERMMPNIDGNNTTRNPQNENDEITSPEDVPFMSYSTSLKDIAKQLGYTTDQLRNANPQLSFYQDEDPIPEQYHVNLPYDNEEYGSNNDNNYYRDGGVNISPRSRSGIANAFNRSNNKSSSRNHNPYTGGVSPSSSSGRRFTWSSGRNSSSNSRNRKSSSNFVRYSQPPNRHRHPLSEDYSESHRNKKKEEQEEQGNNNTNNTKSVQTHPNSTSPPRKKQQTGGNSEPPIGSMQWIRLQQRKFEEEQQQQEQDENNEDFENDNKDEYDDQDDEHSLEIIRNSRTIKNNRLQSTKYYKSEHDVVAVIDNHQDDGRSPVAIPKTTQVLMKNGDKKMIDDDNQEKQDNENDENEHSKSIGVSVDIITPKYFANNPRAAATKMHTTGISLRDLSIIFSISSNILRKYNPALEQLSITDLIPSHYSVVLGPSTTAARHRIKSVMMLLVHPTGSSSSFASQDTTLASLAQDYNCSTKVLKELNPELFTDNTTRHQKSRKEEEHDNEEVPDNFAFRAAAQHPGGIPEEEVDAIPIAPKTKVRVPLFADDDDANDNNNNSSPSFFPNTSILGSATLNNDQYPSQVTILQLAHVLGVRVDDLRRANKSLELMNSSEKIPIEYFPLAAPSSCFATEHERFWRERVSNSLSPPRHKQIQYQLRMKELKEQEENFIRANRKRSPGVSVHSPKVAGGGGDSKTLSRVELSPRETIFSGKNPNSSSGSLSPSRLSPNGGKRFSQGPMVGFPYWKE